MIRFQTLNHLIPQSCNIAKPDWFSGSSAELTGMAGIHGGIGVDAPSNPPGIQGQSGRYRLSVPNYGLKNS